MCRFELKIVCLESGFSILHWDGVRTVTVCIWTCRFKLDIQTTTLHVIHLTVLVINAPVTQFLYPIIKILFKHGGVQSCFTKFSHVGRGRLPVSTLSS